MAHSSAYQEDAQGERLERFYRILSGDESDERACKAIPDSACTALPRNYLLNVANGAASKLAEQVAGPNLVIPWLLGAIGAPAVMVGFLMPLKQAGSLLPQLFVAGAIRRLPRRKWVWSGAAVTQAACLLLIALAAMALTPTAAGGATLVLMLVFSAASGSASVAFQDVTGKTVPKGQRGGLLGNRAAIGGFLAMAAGAYLQLGLGGGAGKAGVSSVLLVFGAALWIVAAVTFAAVTEDAGATEGGRSLGSEFRNGVALVRRLAGYRRFLAARIVLLVIEVSMPFYALHAQSLFGNELPALGLFVLTVGLANVLSSRLLGGLADRSSRGVMLLAAGAAVVTAGAALAIGALDEAWRTPYLYAVVFVLLGFAEQGVRLGRKTYLVDAAPADERPLYVAFANTVVGVFAIALGLLGGIADVFSPAVLVAVLGVLGVLGLAVVALTPPAEAMTSR